MSHRSRSFPCLAFVALLTVACGGYKLAEEPKVTMKSVGLTEVSFTGARGKLAMDVFNPNGFGLPLTKVEWKLTVGDGHAVDGDFQIRETIPARASTPVNGHFRIGASSAMLLQRPLQAGAQTYQLQAVLHFQSKLGPVSVEVKHGGKLADAKRLVAER